MSAEIINLRHVRKQRARAARAAEAAENRVRFGRTRAERDRDALDETQAQRLHEAHRLEPTMEPTRAETDTDTAPAGAGAPASSSPKKS